MITGKKVTLKEISPNNLDWLRQQRNDPVLRKYFREWKDITKDKQEVWYKERGNNTSDNHIYFEIHKNPIDTKDNGIDDSLVGCCGLHYIDWRIRSAEFGVFLDRTERSNGFGKEALFLMFDFGFREMNLHKIWGEVYDNNKALGLYTGPLKMSIEGTIRDAQFHNGEYINSTLISVLEHEWFDGKNKRGSPSIVSGV